MWEIKSDNAKVYLLGSIHLAKSDIYPLDEAIETAYKNSDNIAVEVNVKNVNQFELASMMMLEQGKTLKDELNDSTFSLIENEFKKINIPAMAYMQLKPWAATMLIVQMKLQKAGYNAQSGIDMYFIDKAEKDKKPILELEKMEFQLKMLEKMGDLDDEYFHYSLSDIDKSLEQFENIFKAWKAGDTTEIAAISMDGVEEFESMKIFMDGMLDKRNLGMAEKIDGYLKSNKTYLVIVGSAHMIGNNGLLKLLKEKGYNPIQK